MIPKVSSLFFSMRILSLYITLCVLFNVFFRLNYAICELVCVISMRTDWLIGYQANSHLPVLTQDVIKLVVHEIVSRIKQVQLFINLISIIFSAFICILRKWFIITL